MAGQENGEARRDAIRRLRGAVLVLGAGGFVGANLFRMLDGVRDDVFGVVHTLPSWRVQDLTNSKLLEVDINDSSALRKLFDTVKPATVFNCAAYGAYSFETDAELIYRTNFISLIRLLDMLNSNSLSAFVQAGSSSEYGFNCAAPPESAQLLPNSHYAVSKAATANLITYAGKVRGLRAANLRLYSVYGPYEDTSRLIPKVVEAGLSRSYCPLVSPDISRDFVYVDDVCDAFIATAVNLKPENYGDSFNIGTGQRTTIRDVAEAAAAVFGILGEPVFGTMEKRAWDLANWYADPAAAAKAISWQAITPFAEGLAFTARWMQSQASAQTRSMTKIRVVPQSSITAIIACYKDAQAIPIMHERLVATFKKIDVDYEIIFVNDGSPDDSAGIIQDISATDAHVIGITHSRNFGSQMAFRSGMEIATKEACVLLDGDLQDPPELIEQFYARWKEGYNVVYGRRVKREMPMLSGGLYKAFYRIFSAVSYVSIPHDAGDFSLIDRRAMQWILQCPERDLFMRGLRAYVGFRQTGVDYMRPERMFGRSTNNIFKNVAWAKRGIFSFSEVPLTMLTAGGTIFLVLSFVLAAAQVIGRIYAPELVPPGITTVLLVTLFFGAVNLFAIGLVGEYIAKIAVEVKQRPRVIRAAITRNGKVTDTSPPPRL